MPSAAEERMRLRLEHQEAAEKAAKDAEEEAKVKAANPGFPPPPSLTPLTPVLVDLLTDKGRKYYAEATKEFTKKFDGSKDSYHPFMLTLKDTARERGWMQVCNVVVAGVMYCLFTEPCKISMNTLQAHCKVI
jgi:hypothetical protein